MQFVSDDIVDYITKMRRYFHAHPELSFMEHNTMETVRKELISMGYEPRIVENGGIVADLNVNDGKRIAVRADMDALPVEEENNVEYRSLNKGIMHACGHDAHTAMLLGLAKILSRQREKIKGNVRFLFQQAEESPPGGAQELIRRDALDRVDFVIGQHVDSNLDVGTMGIIPGPIMANADEFRIKIHGKGGHGSEPERAVDAIIVASSLVSSLQTIVSRNISPLSPAVVTVGTFKSGYRYNIIAAHAELTGTVRTYSLDDRELIKRRIEELLSGVCNAHGATYEYEYIDGYPVLINNTDVSSIVESAAKEVVGQSGIVHPPPKMGGEDFSYYTQKIPGAFYFLGVRNRQKGIDSPQHSPTYDIDESSLGIGTGILYMSVLKLLGI